MANPWDEDEVLAPAKAESLGQYGAGNIDLTNRPSVKNPDGSISTVRSMSANFDGQEVLLPTVSDDGRIMSDDEAIDQYRKTGRYLGKFGTVAEADAYADKLHREQESMYAASENPWDADEIVPTENAPLDIEIVDSPANRMAAQEAQQPQEVAPDGWKYGPVRDAAFGVRSAIQGLGGTLGAVGGDAFNNYVVNPVALQLGMSEARPYAQEATALADWIGLPKAQTAGDRILGGIGEGLSSVATGFGAGGLARGAVNPIVANVGAQTLANPGLQVASTVAGTGASGAVKEAGGGPGAQLAAGLIGAIAPAAVRVGAPAVASGLLAGSVPAQRADLAREALNRGIELTPAQLSDSRFVKYVQSALRAVPFTGAARRSEQQVAQFNRAVANAIGESADTVDSQVYAAAKQRQSDLFDQLTSRNALNVDAPFIRSLQNVADNARVNRESSAAIDDAIDYLYSQSTTGPNGIVIPGRAYQDLDSTLGNIIRAGGAPAHYVGQLRDAIRRAMDRSISPQDAQAWGQLRREYGNRKTIAPLVAAAGDEGISPARVLSAATNNASSKEAMASGVRGEMGTLGNIGRLMREPPSSGTAERAAVTSLFTLGGYANPALGALSYTAAQLAARGLDSRTIARLMISQNPGLSMADAERIAAQAINPTIANTSTVE